MSTRAAALDPPAGALLTLGQIGAVVDEPSAAEARWLPDFAPTAAPPVAGVV